MGFCVGLIVLYYDNLYRSMQNATTMACVLHVLFKKATAVAYVDLRVIWAFSEAIFRNRKLCSMKYVWWLRGVSRQGSHI